MWLALWIGANLAGLVSGACQDPFTGPGVVDPDGGDNIKDAAGNPRPCTSSPDFGDCCLQCESNATPLPGVPGSACIHFYWHGDDGCCMKSHADYNVGVENAKFGATSMYLTAGYVGCFAMQGWTTPEPWDADCINLGSAGYMMGSFSFLFISLEFPTGPQGPTACVRHCSTKNPGKSVVSMAGDWCCCHDSLEGVETKVNADPSTRDTTGAACTTAGGGMNCYPGEDALPCGVPKDTGSGHYAVYSGTLCRYPTWDAATGTIVTNDNDAIMPLSPFHDITDVACEPGHVLDGPSQYSCNWLGSFTEYGTTTETTFSSVCVPSCILADLQATLPNNFTSLIVVSDSNGAIDELQVGSVIDVDPTCPTHFELFDDGGTRGLTGLTCTGPNTWSTEPAYCKICPLEHCATLGSNVKSRTITSSWARPVRFGSSGRGARRWAQFTTDTGIAFPLAAHTDCAAACDWYTQVYAPAAGASECLGYHWSHDSICILYGELSGTVDSAADATDRGDLYERKCGAAASTCPDAATQCTWAEFSAGSTFAAPTDYLAIGPKIRYNNDVNNCIGVCTQNSDCKAVAFETNRNYCYLMSDTQAGIYESAGPPAPTLNAISRIHEYVYYKCS